MRSNGVGVREIPIRIGRNQYNDDVWMDLAGDSSHIMVQGKTRSGKSQMTYNVLAQCARNSAVRVVGSDPTMNLLRPFTERGVDEPNIVLGTESAAETVRMLEWVQDEMNRRIYAMGSIGPFGIDKYDTFSAGFPLILVVLEEFPGIIEAATGEDATEGRTAAKKLAPKIQSLTRVITAQSAKAGIRLMVLAQRAEANIVGGEMRSNIGTKLTLRVDEPTSVRMLHPSATPEECQLVELFSPGVGLFERPGHARQIIRCDYVGDYSRYAQAVRSSDLRFLTALQLDRAQREILATEYPGVVDLA